MVLHQCPTGRRDGLERPVSWGFSPQGCGLGQRHHAAHSVCPFQAFPCHPARLSLRMEEVPALIEGVRRSRVWPVEEVLEDPNPPADLRGCWEVSLPDLDSQEAFCKCPERYP